jgi:hypothetical protein
VSDSSGDYFSEFDPTIWLAAVVIVALSLAPVGVMYVLQPGSAASSWLLATAIYIPCLIFAAMTLYFGRATPLKARLIAAGLAVGGLAFAVWGGMVDYGQRATTLFETEVEVAGGRAAQELTFAVEHPGAEHTLTVFPTGAGPLGALESVALRVELFDGEGRAVLAEEATLEPRSADSSTDWDVLTLPFTPDGGGTYTLRVTPLTGGIPRVHVRVEDPLKRDGERMRGY